MNSYGISRTSVLACGFGLLAAMLACACASGDEPSAAARAAEFKALRYGMFICWSFSTFSDQEWTKGVKDVSFFNPSGMDTDQWARVAKESGMNYILFLTKHHDGFCLWDTKTTDWKATKSPLGKDVLSAVRASCDKYGVKLALYFSLGDWTWPDMKNPGMQRDQLTELCTQYGPIEYFWMDVAQGNGGRTHAEIVGQVKSLQPKCFVGFNGGEPGDVILCENGAPQASDTSPLEFAKPILGDGGRWFYTSPASDTVCRSPEAIYRMYAGAAQRNNLFSLDVGPGRDGRLRPIDVETLGKVAALIKQPPPEPGWDTSKAKPEVVEAWKDMRFGMFICWGPVTLTGLEIGWSRGKARPDQKQGGGGPTPVEVYDNLYKKWKPDVFDARAWVKVAQDAGARYVILLIKHHDGFCLYDTKLTDYRSTGPESAWKVDVLKAMADACHEAGVKLVVYYSQPDWHHPDYRTMNHARYIQYLHGQVREILTNYGRIDGLWFDLGGTPADWDSENLFRTARQLQPHLIINNRCGLPGDFDTPEQSLGGFQIERPWETCMTLGTQWSWKPDDTIKSLKQCVDALVTCAVRDGNLALNTNPMPDGQIEPRQAERFREIGQWLAKYGDSVYGTRGGPFRSAGWGGTTRRGDTIYVHVLQWPDAALSLPPLPKKIVASSVLTGGNATVKQTDGGIEIVVAPGDRQGLDTIIALKLDGPAADIKPIHIPSGALTFGKKVAASSVWGPGYEPEMAFDEDETTRWGAAPGSRDGWLEVDLGTESTFRRAVINEEGWNRIEAFELQSWNGAAWQTIASGAKAGRLELKFDPVTARKVRLNILKANDVPTIWEFQLFKD